MHFNLKLPLIMKPLKFAALPENCSNLISKYCFSLNYFRYGWPNVTKCKKHILIIIFNKTYSTTNTFNYKFSLIQLPEPSRHSQAYIYSTSVHNFVSCNRDQFAFNNHLSQHKLIIQQF